MTEPASDPRAGDSDNGSRPHGHVRDIPQLLRAEPDFEQEYPGAERSATECFINLTRVGDRLTAELTRRLRADVGLSMTAIMALATLDGLGGTATPTDIAEHVIITSASVTSLLDTLAKRGLLTRAP